MKTDELSKLFLEVLDKYKYSEEMVIDERGTFKDYKELKKEIADYKAKWIQVMMEEDAGMNAYACPYLKIYDGYWKCQYRDEAIDCLKSGNLDPNIGQNDWPKYVNCPNGTKKQENGFPLCFKSEAANDQN